MSGEGGFAGASPTNCLECVNSACPVALECFADPACVSGIFCGLGSCAGLDGTGALECWVGCFDGDVTLAFRALESAICLSENCAVACQTFAP
jgi:hypothetical protein